ncbi:MAG TPA: sulfotransferase [Tepidisphaeraceae bacterium]|nr:sulfotransferase [Tepidisphaeraceae bacterium]
MAEQRVEPNTAALAAREAAAGQALFAQQRYRDALAHYLQAVRLWPHSADLHFNVASAAMAANEPRLAAPHLARAIQLSPTHALAHDALARAYQLENDVGGALRHSEIAVRLHPGNSEFILTRATALESAGDREAAAKLIAPLLDQPAVADRAAALYAELSTRLGRETDAVKLIERLASLPASSPADRRRLHFAAANLFDRITRFDDGFEHARLAHRILPRPYDRAQYDRAFNLRIEFATRSKLATLPRATHGNCRPVFIVGMPRSGTSLVEQILACHPQVYAAGELDALSRTAAMLDSRGLPYPKSLEALSPNDANALANLYLSAIEQLNPTAARVTDKMPLNFMYLDLVELLLPQASVIHCARNPLDTCLSCYMTDFAIPQAFAERLPDLAHFHRNYERIMGHWKRNLTIPMLEVSYEAVVSDLEAQARRMLDFLGLPWDDRCLRFHEHTRPVATASRDQVRTPLYASSVGRWKNYERHLGQLISALGDAQRP